MKPSKPLVVTIAILIVLIAGASAFGGLKRPVESTTSASQSSSSLATVSSSRTQVTSSTRTTTSSASTPSDLWATYHMDNSRSGNDPNEPGVGSISSAWNSSILDGAVYAEPLAGDDMLLVATENNSVYALNESTGSLVWKTNLGTPVPGSSLPCGDIDPSGITGTPVLNATSSEIYAVAYTSSGHELFSLNLRNGSVNFQRNADPTGVDVSALQQRGALALANGMVYVAYGGLDGDCGQYQGWVVGVPVNDSGSNISYEVPTAREGGIWSPSGPSVEPSGDLLVAIGNSAATSSTSSFDFGDSVVLLSPGLKVLGYWSPSDWANLNAGDTDVGSISPSLLQNGIIFQSGKSGMGYLLNASNLGGIGGELFSSQVCDSAFGGTSYQAPILYVPCTAGLFALDVNTSKPSFTPLWNATGYWAGPPIIAGGAVWTLDTSNSVLYGYSALNGNMIFQYQLGSVVHFETPTSGDHLLFVVDGTTVRAFNI